MANSGSAEPHAPLCRARLPDDDRAGADGGAPAPVSPETVCDQPRPALLPYLLWSGVYLAYRYFAFGAPPDWSRWADYLFWGKAYFHLYFLAVAMQLYLLLPLVLPLARRRPPFWATLIAIVALTMGVYWFNRLGYRLPYTGSFVLWYTPVILLGVWLATQVDRMEIVLRRGWLLALGATIGGCGSIYRSHWTRSGGRR